MWRLELVQAYRGEFEISIHSFRPRGSAYLLKPKSLNLEYTDPLGLESCHLLSQARNFASHVTPNCYALSFNQGISVVSIYIEARYMSAIENSLDWFGSLEDPGREDERVRWSAFNPRSVWLTDRSQQSLPGRPRNIPEPLS